MDFQIALLLGQDGLTNGAIYALLALALVLVFAVTRVIFIPQGEFVAYGALTLATLQAGKLPATLWLMLALGAVIAALDGAWALRHGGARRLPRIVAVNLLAPLALWLLLAGVDLAALPLAAQVALALCVVVPLGPMIYRLAYQPVAEAPVLILLIVSIAVHVVLIGLGLLFFGAEGTRTPAFTEGMLDLGVTTLQYQTLWILAISAILIVALYVFFGRSLYGKALRATALNRTGARLMGISTTMAGKLSFTLAALIGAFSGILISPITTLYYDSGFLIGLKGFVGAIIGGLVSYPVAAAGALLVGFLEAYSSFWASAYKEVIVFTLIIPVLLWRSLTSRHSDEEE
ncbi:MAG: branched-chain amino acid ABC transporter permease [Azospira sp.]|jgi:branched-chain amino acid transport system permease protein|nr:branched-chain amino acid ABC transporter permease [Azospira sp.]